MCALQKHSFLITKSLSFIRQCKTKVRKPQVNQFNADLHENLKIKEEFLTKQSEFEAKVEKHQLNTDELIIHDLHCKACQGWYLTYKDPTTGLIVSTRLKHFLRGKCCGSGCRHCPYEHQEAKPEIKNYKCFNSAFYIDVIKKS